MDTIALVPNNSLITETPEEGTAISRETGATDYR